MTISTDLGKKISWFQRNSLTFHVVVDNQKDVCFFQLIDFEDKHNQTRYCINNKKLKFQISIKSMNYVIKIQEFFVWQKFHQIKSEKYIDFSLITIYFLLSITTTNKRMQYLFVLNNIFGHSFCHSFSFPKQNKKT